MVGRSVSRKMSGVGNHRSRLRCCPMGWSDVRLLGGGNRAGKPCRAFRLTCVDRWVQAVRRCRVGWTTRLFRRGQRRSRGAGGNRSDRGRFAWRPEIAARRRTALRGCGRGSKIWACRQWLLGVLGRRELVVWGGSCEIESKQAEVNDAGHDPPKSGRSSIISHRYLPASEGPYRRNPVPRHPITRVSTLARFPKFVLTQKIASD
jgi:hypothetical protein